MSSYSRRHHNIPRFYLARFTDSGEATGSLWVLDNHDARLWPSTPDGTGFEKDLYRVEHSEIPADSLEKEFAKLEGDASEVIRRIVLSGELPSTPDDFNTLLNFVSLLNVRIPDFINAREAALGKLANITMRMVLETPERWAEQVERMAESGRTVKPGVTYEKRKEFIERGEYEVVADQNWKLTWLLEAHDMSLPLFAQRTWHLLVAAEDAPDFVTSTRPVLLRFTTPVPAFYSPGLGLKNTEVLLPLSRRHLLLGRFEESERIVVADSITVARANSLIVGSASRVILPAHELAWCDGENRIKALGDWLEHLRKVKDQSHVRVTV